MAINFLNTVAFNQNSVEKLRIENQPNDAAAGTGVEGQLYFDTKNHFQHLYHRLFVCVCSISLAATGI